MRLVEKEERAPYGKVEESFGTFLKLYPKASAHFARRRSRSSSRNKLLQCLKKSRTVNRKRVFDLDQTATLTQFYSVREGVRWGVCTHLNHGRLTLSERQSLDAFVPTPASSQDRPQWRPPPLGSFYYLPPHQFKQSLR